jgi:hypothetical protein
LAPVSSFLHHHQEAYSLSSQAEALASPYLQCFCNRSVWKSTQSCKPRIQLPQWLLPVYMLIAICSQLSFVYSKNPGNCIIYSCLKICQVMQPQIQKKAQNIWLSAELQTTRPRNSNMTSSLLALNFPKITPRNSQLQTWWNCRSVPTTS